MVLGRVLNWFTGKRGSDTASQPSDSSPQAHTPPTRGEGYYAKRAPLPRTPAVPLLVDTWQSMAGGVQGLSWYLRLLRQDVDGDTAVQFLHEAAPGLQVDTSTQPLGSAELLLLEGDLHVVSTARH